MSYEVKFSRLRGTQNDLEIITSEKNNSSTSMMKKRMSNLFVGVLYTLFGLIIILTSIFLVTYFVSIDRDEPSPLLREPMAPANEVIVFVSKAENMTCSDHDSCEDLSRRIEQQDGMKYNFVIGSGMELFVGSGFKFSADMSNGTSALYVKVYVDDLLDGVTPEPCWCLEKAIGEPSMQRLSIRTMEIVQQARACGKLKDNVTMTVICRDTFEKCPNVTRSNFHRHLDLAYRPLSEAISVAGEEYKKLYDHYDPDPELGTILMKDFRLLTCERPVHKRRTVKGKVVTYSSLLPATCEPFKPVNLVWVDFERSPPLYCHDEGHGEGDTEGERAFPELRIHGPLPCANVSRLFERDHDVAEYNFVLGTHHDLYVSLGFSCRAPVHNATTETLRIKVLRAYDSGEDQLFRLYGLIKQGIGCGSISSDYTLALNCDCQLKHYIGFMETLSLLQSADEQIFGKKDHGGVDKAHRGKIVPAAYRWKFCNKTDETTSAFPKTLYFPRSGSKMAHPTQNGTKITDHETDQRSYSDSSQSTTDDSLILADIICNDEYGSSTPRGESSTTESEETTPSGLVVSEETTPSIISDYDYYSYD